MTNSDEMFDIECDERWYSLIVKGNKRVEGIPAKKYLDLCKGQIISLTKSVEC